MKMRLASRPGMKSSVVEFIPVASYNVHSTLIETQTGRELSPFRSLKTASGRLRRLWSGRSQVEAKHEGPYNLLVVDDEEAICFSMSEYFSHQGFNVDTAREAEEAERLIESTAYNVIIQDLRLSQVERSDGLEVVRFAHEHDPTTRIVVLTAYGSAENELEAKRSGAHAFLTKPQPLAQLAQVVNSLIQSANVTNH